MEEAGETAFALLDALWYAPVGVAFLDRDLRLVQANEHFARLAGAAADALPGARPRDLIRGDDELAAVAEERLRAVVESGRPLVDASATSHAAHGGIRSWRASAYPVLVPGHGVRGVCLVVDDTTDVRDRAVALDRAREEADRSAHRLAVLQGITAALSAAVEPADVAAAVIERVRLAVEAGAVSLRTVERDGLVAVASAGLRVGGEHVARALPLDARLPATDAIRGDQAIWIESREVLDARYPHLAAVAAAEGYDACAAIPLTARERVLGSISFMYREPRAFDLEERAFVLGIAAQCAQALDRARLQEGERAALAAARAAAGRLTLLQAVTAALSRARTPHEVAEVAVEHASAVLGARVAAAYYLDAGGRTASLHAHRGLPDAVAARYAVVPLDAAVPAAEVLRTGEARWLESQHELAAAFPELMREPGAARAGAMVSVPLRVGGAVAGSLLVGFGERLRFDPELRDLLVSVAEQCGQALERARLYETVQAERDAAERDRALLDDLIDTAPIGVALLDRELRFVRVNRVLAEINGTPPEAHLGRTPVEIIPALPWEEVRATLRSILETGVPRLDFPLSTALPKEPDRIRQFLESWFPVRSGGEVLGIGLLVHEVTAERDAEDFQRHVLGIVGHDLRTPLGAVSTAAHLLARGEPLDERQARLVGRIAAGAARMDQIVGVLLDYAQARGGRGVPVRRRAFDLAALCRAVADECEGASPGRTVRCAGEGDGAGEWDPDRLGQALSNLVSNALDYSPPDSAVDVRWRCGADEVEIEVENANAGAPIPSDTLARMFEPFLRGKRERQSGRKGLGLGLFIARAIVAAHGGRVDARSDERGTVLTVRLPRRSPPQPDRR